MVIITGDILNHAGLLVIWVDESGLPLDKNLRARLQVTSTAIAREFQRATARWKQENQFLAFSVVDDDRALLLCQALDSSGRPALNLVDECARVIADLQPRHNFKKIIIEHPFILKPADLMAILDTSVRKRN